MTGYAQATTLAGGRRVGSRLTHQEEEIINVSFHAFSQKTKEEDGEEREIIDVYKLVEAFQSIDASSDIEDIKLLIADIDENGDKEIDLAEWRHIMSRKFLGEEDDSSFTHVFSMLDSDKDGHIPLVEFRKMLMEEGQAPLSEQEVDELLMFADTESDGLINYRKFLRWLSNPEGYHKDVHEQQEAIKLNRTRMSEVHEDNNRPQGSQPSDDRGGGTGPFHPGPQTGPSQPGPGPARGSGHNADVQGVPKGPGPAPTGGSATPPATGPAAKAAQPPAKAGQMAGPPKAGGATGPAGRGAGGVMAGPPSKAGGKAPMMARPVAGGRGKAAGAR